MEIRSTFPDVSANLYGLFMRVTFLHYLHGELNYPSLEALKAGIDNDVQQLRQYRNDTTQFPFNSILIVKHVGSQAD